MHLPCASIPIPKRGESERGGGGQKRRHVASRGSLREKEKRWQRRNKASGGIEEKKVGVRVWGGWEEGKSEGGTMTTVLCTAHTGLPKH